MRDTPFEVAHFAFQARPGTPVRTVVVKATYALVPSGECTVASTQRFPSGELYHDDDVQQSLRHPDDLAPFKPRGECFVLGHFHAPHGQPVPHGRIAFQIGPVQKALSVFGERRWTTWGPGEPKPTARVPLRWERAFGGPNVPENPVGCGAETVPQLEDATRLLTSPRDRVPPACTTPLNRTWPVRAKLVGTYDREWLATAYPFLAADVRLEYFCAAPPDQRIEGHWRGDETIVLVNLVPDWPHVHCRLPGLWPRAAWVMADAPGHRAEVREIPLVLDTITVDGDAREVHAVWRCTTAEPTDCTHLVVLHHRLGETIDLGRAALALIERQRQGEAEAEPEAPPIDARASVAPPSVAAPSLADATARQAQRGEVAGVSASVAGQLARGLEASAPAARPLDETKLAELEAREAAARDRWMRSIANRRELERAVSRGESCAGLDLSELDLSELRLENADLSGANLRGTSLRGAVLSRVSLDGAMLDGADLSGARFVAVSMLEASLVECEGPGARFEDCNLRDAVLERATLPRVHFQRVRAQGAILRGATLSECWFEECDLTHADLGEANVESTLFSRCDASDAHFGEGAILKRARFEQCRLRGLRAFEADCEELSLTESMAERARFGASKLARARFLAVNLERADFSKADLTEAAFGRCHLRKARLDEAKLEGAQLLSADLFQARLENADLRNADLRGANLFQAELLGAQLEGARLELANLTGTRLEAR